MEERNLTSEMLDNLEQPSNPEEPPQDPREFYRWKKDNWQQVLGADYVDIFEPPAY